MAEVGNAAAIFSPHFFVFAARPHRQPTPARAGVTFPPASGERHLPPLPAGQRPGQAGEHCPHPASIRAAARTTIAVEKSS